MVDILHRVGVKTTSPDDVYAALTTVDGLSGWWTRDTSGRDAGQDGGEVGDRVTFRFPSAGGFFDMEVVDLDPGTRVRWQVVDGPAEWIGTLINWDLRQEGDQTTILFKHEGWQEPVEFMHHCSTKWATYLLSLKALIETGTGAPDPDDVKIDSFN
jgi:uncharacterized protein YndB with AHSA1/START domain